MSIEGKTAISTILITPEPGDDRSPLVCKAFSQNLPGTVLQDQITLQVHCKFELFLIFIKSPSKQNGISMIWLKW